MENRSNALAPCYHKIGGKHEQITMCFFRSSQAKHSNLKDQAPAKLQGSKIKFSGLVLEYSLELGSWNLEVPILTGRRLKPKQVALFPRSQITILTIIRSGA